MTSRTAPAPLVLASASPRRSELLRNAGIEFIAQPARLSEAIRPGESAMDYARRMAREKAFNVQPQHPEAVVLAADTVVVVDETVLGKPRDADDAARMLRLLSGRWHQVITAVCLLGPEMVLPHHKPQHFEDVRAETTEVFMDSVSEEEILAYVASGQPMDKAGAYAIQGQASRWISKIVGCYFNVVGLPVPLVFRMLREHGTAAAK